MSDLKPQAASPADFEEELWDLLRAKEYAVAAELLRNTRTAVVERVLDRTPPSLMPLAFRLLDKDVAVEVFSNMEPMLQSDLIDGLADEHTQDLFSQLDRKSTRLNSSHVAISYAVFCLKKKKLCMTGMRVLV